MRRYNWCLALLITLASCAMTLENSVAASPSQAVYFATTKHALAEPYLSQWLSLGGREQIGEPVTEVVVVTDRNTQFFQYGVLAQRSTSRVSRLKAGELLLESLHLSDQYRSDTRRIGSVPTDGAFMPIAVPLNAENLSARHTYMVDPTMKTAYEDKGGHDFLGDPISAAFFDSGKEVQWFEYGRLEIVDGLDVLAPVGYELAMNLGVDVSPVDRGDTPLFESSRFQLYQGDGVYPNAVGSFTPARIAIPKISVNATVESVAIVDGVMGVPVNAWNVGWYPTLSTPGDGHNVVIAGHRDWWGVGPVVFWRLNQLIPGDRIYLIAPDGTAATYQVTMNWLVDADIDAGLLTEDVGFEVLTLITCGGSFNGIEYDSRQVIRAVRI